MAQAQLGGPLPGDGKSIARRPMAALVESRAVKVTDLVIGYLLSTYYVPGVIPGLRAAVSETKALRPGVPCSETQEPCLVFT